MITQDDAVRILTQAFRVERPDIEVGAGYDDVAIVKIGIDRLAISADFTNFRPLGVTLGGSTLADRGYLLIVHNVSDLIGSGALPLVAVVALGLPTSCTEEDVLELARGIRSAADACGVVVVGGDTKEAPCFALTATVIGRTEQSGHWCRGGAKPGDHIFLSGAIGGTTAATIALSASDIPENLGSAARIVLARPTLPLAVAKHLRHTAGRIASIDVSDGFGLDLNRLADASQVGLEVEGEQIPLHRLAFDVAKIVGVEPLKFALGFGGDAQFVFTVEPDLRLAAIEAGATEIGIVTDSPLRSVNWCGRKFALPKFGHEDFTGVGAVERLWEFVKRPLDHYYLRDC